MKKLFSIVIILLCFKTSQAQTNVDSINLQLRQLFSTIAPPNPNTGYLYDMVAHFVDSSYFSESPSYKSNADVFFNLYQEMRYMAYDTTQILRTDTVYNRADAIIKTDTIPLGFIQRPFNILKPDALTTGTYFNFDTTNNILTDIPGAPTPYNRVNIFQFSTLSNASSFQTVVFSFDPQFYFLDQTSHNDLLSGVDTLEIDFGDGNGFQTIDYSLGLQYFTITYPIQGEKTLVAWVHRPDKDRISRCTFSNGDLLTTQMDTIMEIGGIKANVYNGGCTTSPYNKVVIYLEGIDPLENRSASIIYDQMIRSSRYAQLRNLGYTFVVVNWINSGDDIRNNAKHLIKLIETLKCLQGTTSKKEQFVIIGESMGGLVARYALTYMESADYESSMPCADARTMHNCRLFISQDVPHQGANIPLGVQHLYKDIDKSIGIVSIASYLIWGKYLKFLNSTSSHQMLIYHANTENGNTYNHSGAFTDFFDDLQSIGNYPRYCKNVAMVNGSMGGNPQANIYGNPRIPNDNLFSLNGFIKIRVLGIKVKIFDNQISVRTNPSGFGNVYTASAGTFWYKIKLKIFGVKVVLSHNNLHNVVKNANGVLPHCTNQGSFEGRPILQNPSMNGIVFDLMNDLHLIESSSSPGSFSFAYNTGSPYYLSPQTGFTATSDGFHWGFIPTKSAFDYQLNPNNLNERLLPFDLAHLDTLLDNSPFDLVICNFEDDDTTFTSDRNAQHLHQRNVFQPLNLLPPCSDPSIRSYLINREIGDDTLFVDNMTLNRNGNYGSQINIQVNTFGNHLYDYKGSVMQGMRVFSKRRLFQYEFANPTYSASFAFGVSGTFVNINGTYQTPNIFITNCCTNYTLNKMENSTIGVVPSNNTLEVFPNPSSNSTTLRYQFQEKGNITIQLFDITGKLVFKKIVSNINATTLTYTPIYFNELTIHSGLYLFVVDNGKQKLFSKFVKN